MCGIAGIVGQHRHSRRREKLQKMLTAIEYRGPDDEDIYESSEVILGHRRLSILDLSKNGRQPMGNTDRSCWVTHNGEIYNYLELRKTLPAREYKSQTDTEVLLHAYDVYGERCVEHFNGIFAFAIWNDNTQTLFCARDQLGVKPFYYAFYKGRFIFGSEIKAILASGVKTSPNEKVIYDYLANGVYEHSDETFFEGIYQLRPGHSLTLKNGKIHLRKYWDVADKALPLGQEDRDHWGEHLIDLFKDSVQKQLRSDVPIGCHLSGGIDSSILASTIRENLKDTSSLGLASYYYDDVIGERPLVEQAEQYFKQRVEYTCFTANDVIENIDNVLWHEEQPFPGIVMMAKYKSIENPVNQNATVFFEGHGGDEIFAGYKYYFGSFLLDILGSKGGDYAERELNKFYEVNGKNTKDQQVKFLLGSMEAYLKGGRGADGTSFIKRNCLRGSFLRKHESSILDFDLPFESHLSNMQYRDLVYTKLPRVLRSCDRASMASSREMRVPFLDPRLVEFAFSLPIEERIQNGVQRKLVRQSFQKMLPEEILHRPKLAVVDPQRRWLRNQLRPWAESILSSTSFGDRGFFDQSAVLKEYKRYCTSQNNENSFFVWQWLNLELWFRAFFD